MALKLVERLIGRSPRVNAHNAPSVARYRFEDCPEDIDLQWE